MPTRTAMVMPGQATASTPMTTPTMPLMTSSDDPFIRTLRDGRPPQAICRCAVSAACRFRRDRLYRETYVIGNAQDGGRCSRTFVQLRTGSGVAIDRRGREDLRIRDFRGTAAPR